MRLSPQFGVGASGAIFGLLGVALVFGIKYRRELPGGMGDRMRRSLTPVLLLTWRSPLRFRSSTKARHLGGLIAGALLAALTESRTASAARREREIVPVPLALVTAIGLLGYGVWGLAKIVPIARTVCGRAGRRAARRRERGDTGLEAFPDGAIEHRGRPAKRESRGSWRKLCGGSSLIGPPRRGSAKPSTAGC